MLNDGKNSSREDRTKWTLEQDNTLSDLAIAHGSKNWNAIALHMNEKFPFNKKTSKQCRERWHYCLDLKINHKPWSKQEEAILLLAHMDYGNHWCDISTYFKGRHNNMIKNRFYSILRKVKNKIRNKDYNGVDQLELVEMHYMAGVMINYIRNPAPAEDSKRRRKRDFMYSLINDINLTTLEQFSSDLLVINPLKESLREALSKIIEVERSQEKASPGSTSSLSKLLADLPVTSLGSQITVERILEFCWGNKGEQFVLSVPPSFDCKKPFSLDERNSISKGLFYIKSSNVDSPLTSYTMTGHH